jgi:hypothetical protein
MTTTEPVTASYQILKRPAVIWDVDGTLADTADIVHHVAASHPRHTGMNYPAFHEAARTIPARKGMPETARCWNASGILNIIVTARSAEYRHYLIDWLDDKAIPAALIRMRAIGDYRPDVDVKRDHVRVLTRTFKLVHAYDDNPHIVAMLREEFAIETTHIPGWTP